MQASTFDDVIQVLSDVSQKLETVKQVLELSKQPHRVKLSKLHAKEIRMLHREGWSKEDLAKKYGVGVSCIKNVIYGVSWRA